MNEQEIKEEMLKLCKEVRAEFDGKYVTIELQAWAFSTRNEEVYWDVSIEDVGSTIKLDTFAEVRAYLKGAIDGYRGPKTD